MLNNISWQGYWLTIALLTGGYYLVIYLLYFRSDFKVQLPSGSLSKNQNHVPVSTPFLKKDTHGLVGDNSRYDLIEKDAAVEFQAPSTGDDESLTYSCMDELNAFFEEARKRKPIKDELVYALKLILKKYASLKDSMYRDTITNVIVTQCDHICSIHLNEGDVFRMWF